MSKELFTVKEYGHIEIHLKELLEQRQITRNALARAINTRFEVIDKWCKNNVEKLDLDVLARICYALDCTPSDIIKHIGNNK